MRLNVATWEKVKKNNEWVEETEWHDVILFGSSAKFINEYSGKGGLVYVCGKIKTRKYTSKDNIEKTKTEIFASEIKILGSGKHTADSPNESRAANTNAPAQTESAAQVNSQVDEYGDSIPF
jgi:single-strand DNA-binding protein